MNQHRLVVIDDEEELLENYVALLSDDFQVIPFSSAKDFLASMESPEFKAPDLVITDFKMPGVDGIEMVRRSQKKNFYFPVILLSGFLDKASVLEAVDIGVYRLLEKPTELGVLRSAIDQLLIEGEVYRVRQEIRMITSQLREFYTTLRMTLAAHLPEDVMNRTVIEAKSGSVVKAMSFEDLLETLESRLDQLLKSEKVLNELRDQKFRG